MRLGGPILEPFASPTEWAAAHRRLGYRAALLPGSATLAAARKYAAAAEAAELVIAEVGAWGNNPISPDQAVRKKSIQRCIKKLALAEEAGARCCVNVAGSRGEKWDGPHEENLTAATFDLIVDSVRQIIDAVKPKRTCYALEAMCWALPESPSSYAKLLKAIDRKAFGVHLDPVNMVTSPARAYDTTALLRECFSKLGPHIRSCHAKDIRFTRHLALHFDECRPGAGVMDYREYLRQLKRLDPDTPLILEHLRTANQYRAAASFIRGLAA